MLYLFTAVFYFLKDYYLFYMTANSGYKSDIKSDLTDWILCYSDKKEPIP